MRWRSSRTRIAVTSALLSALVLASFAVPTWMLMYRVSLKRLDLLLGEEAFRQSAWLLPLTLLKDAKGYGEWPPNQEAERRFAFLLRDEKGRTVYRSRDWPKALGVRDLPVPNLSAWPVPRGPSRDEERPPPGDHDWSVRSGRHPPLGKGTSRKAPAPPEPPREWERPWPRGPAWPEGKEPPIRPSGKRPGPEQRRFSPRLGPRPPPPSPTFVSRRVGAVQWRIALMVSPWGSAAVAARVSTFAMEMRSLRNAFLLALPASLLLLGVSGWLLSQRALRPVRELAEAVSGITAKGLNQHLPAREEDEEFQRLTAAFNEMLDRLERSFHQAIRFSADAAHELKTPLAVLQGELETALQAAPDGSEQQQTYGALLEEVQRLKSIVQKLLLLSRADAGQLTLNLAPVNLSQAAQALCDDIEIMAPHLTVNRDLAPDVWVSADEDLLRQMLSNLVSNAIRYNRDQGLIALRLTQDDSLAMFVLSNTGPEIPPEDRGRIFDRFYRADPARTREDEGVGLGLSIAREIAWAHHGDLVLQDSDNGLITFSLTLPLAEHAQQTA